MPLRPGTTGLFVVGLAVVVGGGVDVDIAVDGSDAGGVGGDADSALFSDGLAVPTRPWPAEATGSAGVAVCEHDAKRAAARIIGPTRIVPGPIRR